MGRARAGCGLNAVHRSENAVRAKMDSAGGEPDTHGEGASPVTHLSETTSKDLIVATTDFFGNDSLVSSREIILILGAFVGYLKCRKPPIQ